MWQQLLSDAYLEQGQAGGESSGLTGHQGDLMSQQAHCMDKCNSLCNFNIDLMRKSAANNQCAIYCALQHLDPLSGNLPFTSEGEGWMDLRGCSECLE